MIDEVSGEQLPHCVKISFVDGLAEAAYQCLVLFR
jgi:hypothetical protein